MLFSKILKNLGAFFCATIFFFLISFVALASWIPPSQTPTGGNVPPPINEGDDLQRKTGSLRVGGFRSDFDTWLATDGGNVGIGTTSPGHRLDVSGNVRLSGDIIAISNIRQNCAWSSWTCNANAICGNNKFVAGVGRQVGGAPQCGSSPDFYYNMQLYCCDL